MLNCGPNDWKYIAGFLSVSLFTSEMHSESSHERFLVQFYISAVLLLLQNRSEHQCQHRWFKVLDPDLVKGPWTKEEDEKVRCVDKTAKKMCAFTRTSSNQAGKSMEMSKMLSHEHFYGI